MASVIQSAEVEAQRGDDGRYFAVNPFTGKTVYADEAKRQPLKFPTSKNWPKISDEDKFPQSLNATTIIYDNAKRIAAEIIGKNIPAADLTNEQKCAIFTLAGFMKYENGKLVSIRPVGIADRGDGTYIVGMHP